MTVAPFVRRVLQPEADHTGLFKGADFEGFGDPVVVHIQPDQEAAESGIL